MPDKADDPALFALFNEIWIISQLSATMFERVMPYGLTLAQFSVLNHLSRRKDPQAPQKLAGAFQVSKGTMSSTLAKLEAKNLVTITPNPRDGRGKLVTLSNQGRQAREEAIAALGPDLAWLAGHTQPQHIASLTDDLSGIRKLLDARRDGQA